MRLERTAVPVVAAALLAVPAPAAATITCDYSAAGKLLAVATLDSDVRLAVDGDEIAVSGFGTPIACTGPGGPPTVTNTGAISVTGGSRDKVFLVDPVDFAPGPDPQDASDSAGGSKEIEIFVNLDAGPRAELVLLADAGGRELTFGVGGINANGAGEAAPRDADIFLTDERRVSAVGGSGNDALYAQGGLGTGGPLTDAITLVGGAGADSLTGGDGPDALFGAEGRDLLFGMAGDDTIAPGAGDDAADGGPGRDTVSLTAFEPVTLDLAVTARQATGEGSDALAGFENASTEVGPATLRGDEGPNVLSGSAGADTLEGRGGDDVLNGRDGPDALDVRDGGRDTADCGDGADTVTADGLGVDLLTGCESAIFPAADVAPEPAAVPAFGARTLVRLRRARRRVPPLAVRVSNANSFPVSVALAGRSFQVPANASRTVRVRLKKPLRRRSIRLTAQVRDPAGATRTIRRTLRVRARQDRRRKR